MRRTWIALATAVVVAATCSSCGDSNAARSGGQPVMGTTDQVTSLDPAAAYDQGSWQVYGNVYQTLLSFAPGSDTPQPDAATKCAFPHGSSTVYECDLRSGLKFSNGDPLTAQDVAFSFTRIKTINSPEGPSPLMSNLRTVTASGNQIIFTLKKPDATFPMKIATGAGSIVDRKVYPAGKALAGDGVVGSGVYEIKSYKQGDHIQLVPNPNYIGAAKRTNNGASIKYYATAPELAAALKNKDIDFVPRDLPSDVENKYADGVNGYQSFAATSPLTHLVVFDGTHAPFNNPAVRRAVAYLVDREAIVRDVYARTVQPLYSLIPQGILGHTTPFFDEYGGDPDVAKATAILKSAGVQTPVHFTLTAASGVAPVPEGNEIKKELENSGLFSVTVKHMTVPQVLGILDKHTWQAFTIGWSADYPDADDFVSPLLVGDSVFHDGYQNSTIATLLDQTRSLANRQSTMNQFAEIQKQEAADVPILPLWQSKDYAVSTDNVQGVSLSTDAAGITCLWVVSVGKGS